MLIRFGDVYLNTKEISYIQINRAEEMSASISLKSGEKIELNEGIDYLMTIFDAYHFINVQKLRDNLPEITQD
jgi:hypothetical protein